MKDLNIVIVGAGIGGLQTALALAKDDHRVTVLESAKAFEEVCIALRMQSWLASVAVLWGPEEAQRLLACPSLPFL